MGAKIAVLSRSFSNHPVLRAEVASVYDDVVFNDSGRTLAGDELVAFLKGADRAIVALERIDDSVLARLPRLKIVAKYGVGLDNIDIDALRARGISLGWQGGVNRRSVAELALAFAIMMLRHLPMAHQEVLDGRWRQHIGRDLSARTVGIVGCGHIGQDLARLLRAFGCRVLAHDLRDLSAFHASVGSTAATLDTLLTEAEVVSLHLPLTALTAGLFDAGTLARMRRDAILINTSRGGIVDETALRQALASGALAGAAFDVFGTEPPNDLELLALPNFFASPHLGGSSAEAVLAMGRAAIRGLETATDPLAFRTYDEAGLLAR